MAILVTTDILRELAAFRSEQGCADGRVDTLLLEERGPRPAWECAQCGRPAAEAGSCRLDGATLVQRPDGADVAIHQGLAHGGDVVHLGAGALGGVDGIGALTRF